MQTITYYNGKPLPGFGDEFWNKAWIMLGITIQADDAGNAPCFE
jgi:hypothetical protein